VNNALPVEVLKSQHNLSKVRHGPPLIQGAQQLEHGGAIPAVAVLLHQVEVVDRLKRVVELHKEGVVRARHDLALRVDVIRLVLANHFLLLQHFDGVVKVGELLLSQEHLAKGPLADWLDNLKVINRDDG